MTKRSGVFWIPALILASALLGGMFHPRVGVAAAASDDEIKESFRVFSKVLDKVEQNYADKVDAEAAIYQGAIPQMLAVLDPHSQFFDPESFKRLREDQRGKYAGVGMTISTRNNQTVVVHPFPKTPAYRAGLRPGDIIVEVDGMKMDGLNTTEVANRLRGTEGTQVEIAYERPSVEGLTRVTVTRDTIPRPSVPVSFEIRPNVGFVKVESFNETTGQELEEAIEKMGGDESLEGLILDLRDNRGGLLSQGVRVSEKFLERGQTIVSHHGRASSERAYRAQRSGDDPKYPVVVMVNCHSASASEIVAGALQDHDRALIVGNNTFGKGLVQTVIPVGDEPALATPTARYYPPRRRLIPRRYDGVSLVEYYNDPCSDHYKPNHEEVKTTDSGRKVFGGGGIAPDIMLTEQRLNDIQILLARRFAFENFAQHYTLERPNMAPGWEPSEEAIQEFRDFLNKEEVEISDEDFNANLDFIKRFLKRAVYISAYDVDEGEKVYYALDPDVEKALEALPQAKALLDSQGSVVAQRR